jgi:hypothetical protein
MNSNDSAVLDEPMIDIDANRRLLNRYRYIEQETMRIFAGWLPATALFELKCEYGRTIWESSQHVNALYLRLREIQSPAFQKPADPAIIRLMQEMLHAPNEIALAVAYWRVLKPAVIAAMKNHAETTFPNTDLPSVYALDHIVLDQEAQAKRMESLLAQFQKQGRIDATVLTWEKYTRELLAAAGGVTGDEARPAGTPVAPAVRKNFVFPREVARDQRFTNLGGDVGMGSRPPEEDYEAHTRMEFERYSTEMLAAETVADVMFHVTDMPWEFQHDSARHLYDEVRHCLIGYDWLKRHGGDPFSTPQFLQVFKWRTRFTPVQQYCMLTMGNEVNAFPYRHRRLAAHEKSGDRYSEQQVRYDVADETQHVRFGRRWLTDLIKASGEKRSEEKFIADTLEIWEKEYRTGLLPVE